MRGFDGLGCVGRRAQSRSGGCGNARPSASVAGWQDRRPRAQSLRPILRRPRTILDSEGMAHPRLPAVHGVLPRNPTRRRNRPRPGLRRGYRRQRTKHGLALRARRQDRMAFPALGQSIPEHERERIGLRGSPTGPDPRPLPKRKRLPYPNVVGRRRTSVVGTSIDRHLGAALSPAPLEAARRTNPMLLRLPSDAHGHPRRG